MSWMSLPTLPPPLNTKDMIPPPNNPQSEADKAYVVQFEQRNNCNELSDQEQHELNQITRNCKNNDVQKTLEKYRKECKPHITRD